MDFSRENKTGNKFTVGELNQLLEINKAITEAKTAVELLASIREKVSQLIPFDDTGILIVEKDGMYHYDMAVNIPGWDDSNANKKLQEHTDLKRIKHPGSYLEDVIKRLEKSNSPIIEDYNLRLKEFDYPFFEILEEVGYKEGLVTVLKSNGITYGTFWLNSLKKNHFKQEHFNLFEAIAAQVSVAVANILAQEELVNENRTKAILLDISEHIAAIDNRKELFTTIINEIKPIIPIDDTGILVLNKAGTHWQDWTNIENFQETDAAKNLNLAGFTDYIPLDHFTEIAFNSTGIFSIKEVIEANHPFATIMTDAGLKEFMFTPLISHGKTIGSLFFDSQTQGTYSPKYFDTFKVIANMVASAVSNILSNEEIKEREKEKSLLLDISNSISQINNKVDLLKSINELLWPIFHHDDAGFSIVDKDHKYFIDYHNLYSQEIPYLEEAKFFNGEVYKGVYNVEDGTIPFPDSIVEHYMYRKPEIGKLKDVLSLNRNTDLLKLEIEHGLVYYICSPLTTGGKTLGLFNLLFKEENKPNAASLSLFTQIAEIMALAFSNILANEELLEREKEKDILLNISQKLSNTTKADELLQVIIREVKPIFNFYDTGVLVIDENAKGVYDLSVVYPHIDNSEVNDFLNNKGYYKDNQLLPLKNSVVEWILQQFDTKKLPIVFNYQKDYSTYSDGHLLEDLKKGGYISAWMCPLVQRGKIFGVFSLNFTKHQTIPIEKETLLLALADRIASSLANILTKEEILESEKEKSVLLSLSESIATIRDTNELWKVMIEKVKPILGFKASVSTIYSPDYSKYCYYLFSSDVVSNELPENLKKLFHVYVPIKDTSDEWVLQQGDVCTLTLEEKKPLARSNPESIEILRTAGIEFNLYIKLKVGGKIIGVQHYHFESRENIAEKTISLARSITDLIAIALANILANEEILKREIEKSRLLKISGAISRISNKQDLLKVIYGNITPVFPFDSAGLFITDLDRDVIYEVLDSHAYPDDLQQALENSNDLGPWKLSESNIDSWWMKETIVIRSMETEAELSKGSFAESQFNAGLAYGLKHFIGGPMYANGKKIGAICFNSKQENFYSEENLFMFQSLSEQISVAIANILANEDITKRAEEKALLLRLSTELSLKRSIHGVTALIFERIKSLINAEGIVLTLLSEDKKSYKAVQHESSPEVLAIYQADKEYRGNFNKNVPLHLDPFISGEQVFEKRLPFYAKVADILKSHPDHAWANLMHKAGTESTTVYVLRLNEQPFGAMFWHWQDELANPEDIYPMIQGIGDLVAITISNLISSSELEERAKEIEYLNQKLEEQNAYLEEEILGKYNFGEIIGESPALQNIYHNIKLVSKTDTTVLITGETGTGKELIARAIHEASDRRGKTLIKLNCAALPAQLIESELFGHERGAFTGAIERRIGKFELAHESTIFLDEVGELPLDLQAKLLRVLQERELERLGGSKVIKTNVRVLSATNRDLQKEVQAGKFRSDLYYRLNVFPIHLPPLRERKEDIPPLVHHFLGKYQKKLGKQVAGVSNKVMTQLTSYPWPGNIRELEHVLERSCILSTERILKEIHLPKIHQDRENYEDNGHLSTLADNEKTHILKALKHCNWKVSGLGGAAELLDLKPSTLEFRMKKLGIRRLHQ
ncbi:sigma-54-dependent Fis family transcriptional regulator [Pararhodonellum marinum]|uniref:sigma-54-dependent Fis family transcriptional regulator n=1 Tax=Pararhodonellum marinum TaxID=2755358 RepID=UPI00188E792F|nr:sigma 54-interacting transcriptional regulator [Pararhodonellum marinum]